MCGILIVYFRGYMLAPLASKYPPWWYVGVHFDICTMCVLVRVKAVGCRLPLVVVVVVVRVEPIGVPIGADWLYGNGGGVGRTVGCPRVDWAHTTVAPEGRAEAWVVDVPGGGPGGRGVAGGPTRSPGRTTGGVVAVVTHLTSPSFCKTETDNSTAHRPDNWRNMRPVGRSLGLIWVMATLNSNRNWIQTDNFQCSLI